ncbi:MAG: endo-1,4-beta-xylanase, partial [Planctomycetota bacterium]
MRFLVLDPSRIDRQALEQTCLVGQEDLPYAGRAYLSGQQLIVERREDASACLWAPWTLPDSGQWMLATSTLMERSRPYLLEVELARGSVFRVRNQLALWEQLGLRATPELRERVAKAMRSFAKAATRQQEHAKAALAADEALRRAAAASVLLANLYSEQAIQVRVAATPRLPTLIGARLGESCPSGENADALTQACSMVAVPAAWKTIEASEGKRRWRSTDDQMTWAHNQGLRIACGPLLELDEHCLPEWSYLWEGDFEAVASLMLAHVKAVVSRYKGRVQLWHVASRINRSGVLSLTDEQRLQLAARAVRAAREIDPKTPIVVGFDQPWGEYMASQTSDLGPIDFADALERADLGISGFGIELNIGY